MCATGVDDCNGDASDGCETDITSATDCGGCGKACGVGQGCEKGSCVTCGDAVNIGKPAGSAPGTSIGSSLGIFAWAYVPTRTTIVTEIDIDLFNAVPDPQYTVSVYQDIGGAPSGVPLDIMQWNSGAAHSLNHIQVESGKTYWIGMSGNKSASLPSVQGPLITMYNFISGWTLASPPERLPIAFSVMGSCL